MTVEGFEFFVVAVTSLPSCYLATTGDTHTHRHGSDNSSIVACIRYRGNVFTEQLPSIKGRIYFAEPLPSNDGRDARADTQTDGRDL
jgi:hypothetical protein